MNEDPDKQKPVDLLKEPHEVKRRHQEAIQEYRQLDGQLRALKKLIRKIKNMRDEEYAKKFAESRSVIVTRYTDDQQMLEEKLAVLPVPNEIRIRKAKLTQMRSEAARRSWRTRLEREKEGKEVARESSHAELMEQLETAESALREILACSEEDWKKKTTADRGEAIVIIQRRIRDLKKRLQQKS